jgi:hypothetical protein
MQTAAKHNALICRAGLSNASAPQVFPYLCHSCRPTVGRLGLSKSTT